MTAKTLMVQGTASSVGKSLLTTALCRYFRQQGLRVAPFKAINMALNSFVTPDGLEIGRSQAVQAEACGIEPCAEMNPLLLKCEPGRIQAVLMGKVVGSLTAEEYDKAFDGFRPAIAGSLESLRSAYDLVILEGMGSPVEVNLKRKDAANMEMARLAQAPVILVGDIDRGGVFASLLGTLELFEPSDRVRVKGFVINKFRGEKKTLEPGFDFLKQKTGVPVLGVLPYLTQVDLAEEDSVALEESLPAGNGLLTIAVLKFPHISNFDEFQPLARTPGVHLRYVQDPREAQGADLVVLPGTKMTVADLKWLRVRGFETLLRERAKDQKPILGICGGYQMLGEAIEDPHQVESRESSVPGLDLLSVRTFFEKEKVTAQVEAVAVGSPLLTGGQKVKAYEIHMGRVMSNGANPLFQVASRNRRTVKEEEGAVQGAVMGTLLHGLFENDSIRRSLLNALAKQKGLEISVPNEDKEASYNRLAEMVRISLDCSFLKQIIGF
ncbi:MAG TPA: cobyric acid synthase [bacterium]|nr:cobyric acid synthase [bacterium]